MRAKTAAKFRFPFFKEMMLFAASKYLKALRAQQVTALEMQTATQLACSLVGLCDCHEHLHAPFGVLHMSSVRAAGLCIGCVCFAWR